MKKKYYIIPNIKVKKIDLHLLSGNSGSDDPAAKASFGIDENIPPDFITFPSQSHSAE